MFTKKNFMMTASALGLVLSTFVLDVLAVGLGDIDDIDYGEHIARSAGLEDSNLISHIFSFLDSKSLGQMS